MATAVRRERTYASYGNVAYDPAYLPRREGTPGAEERPVIRQRERVKSRAKVAVRPAGYVAPTAVLGFCAVAVVAVMIIMSMAQIAVTSSQVVDLKGQSADLAEEHSKLLSEYELAFDLKTVEEIATTEGGMIQPVPGQEITMDISEPDSAQVYSQDGDPLGGLWTGLTETVDNIVAFFR